MTNVRGGFDYDSFYSGEGRLQIVDALGNVISDIPLSDILSGLKPTRDSLTKEIDAQSISPSDKSEFTVSNTDGYSAIMVYVRATYNASATAGVRVRWLYSPNGSDYDSEEDAEAQSQYYDLSFAAGETRQATVLIPIFAPYIKVQVVNLDSSYSVEVTAWKLLLR